MTRIATLLAASLLLAPLLAIELKVDGYHVFPGDNIQEALDLAARDKTNKVVQVHAGFYRPAAKRQALVWLNRAHDGIRLEAIGEVTLSAANELLSAKTSRSHPAIVNHVLYLGDGLGSNTIVRGFKITGANGYVTDKFLSQIEPDTTIPKNSFFLTDGGAIKVFGRSSPVLDSLVIEDNYTSPCGGGISIQQQGRNANPVDIRNCIFKSNRAQVTGGAVDLLEGSSARILNCLFVGNASNLGTDVVARQSGEPPFVNSGVLTIFTNSVAVVRNCTFVGNRNGVDDMAAGNRYENCIFFQNDWQTGLPGERFDLHLAAEAKVSGCHFQGRVLAPINVEAAGENRTNSPDPKFDAAFAPQDPAYRNAGYRPLRAFR